MNVRWHCGDSIQKKKSFTAWSTRRSCCMGGRVVPGCLAWKQLRVALGPNEASCLQPSQFSLQRPQTRDGWDWGGRVHETAASRMRNSHL
jgi:hypothetical protein